MPSADAIRSHLERAHRVAETRHADSNARAKHAELERTASAAADALAKASDAASAAYALEQRATELAQA
jgi:hypothetical protein